MEEERMHLRRDHIIEKNSGNQNGATNVVHLIKRAKLERKKERRHTILITMAAITALAISGIIISQ